MTARDDACGLCPAEPDDWCPGCGMLLCPDHSRWHRGSLDGDCTQPGPPLDPGWVDYAFGLAAEQLDTAGVGVGRLGVTDDGHRAVFRCVTCRQMFTVTGPPSVHYGLGCLADDCASYDLDRDADVFFDAAVEAGWIRRQGPGDAVEEQT